MKRIMTLLALLQMTISVVFSSDEPEWKQVGEKGVLIEILQFGYTPKEKLKETEKELSEQIQLTLPAIDSLPCSKVKETKEWVLITYSVSTEYSIASESFAVRANFKKKEFEIIDILDLTKYDLSIHSYSENIGLSNSESLCATMKYIVVDGKRTIEVVNSWKN